MLPGNARTAFLCFTAMDCSPGTAKKLLWDTPSVPLTFLGSTGTSCKCQMNSWAHLDGFEQLSCGPAWAELTHPPLTNTGRGCTHSEFSLIFFVLSSLQPLDTLKALKKPSINSPGEGKVLCRHFWAKRRRRQSWE